MSTEIDKNKIIVPKDVTASFKKHMLEIKGPLGKTYKNFRKIPINVTVVNDVVELKAQGTRKKDIAILGTAKSIVTNLCQGVIHGYTIKMKIVFAHFPITVKVQGKKILIENFQGERSARITDIVGSTKVTPKGDDVILTGSVLTDVTQTAANIQLTTKIKNKDHRVFLDGIYIFEKTDKIEK